MKNRQVEKIVYRNIDGKRVKVIVCKPYLKEGKQTIKPKREIQSANSSSKVRAKEFVDRTSYGQELEEIDNQKPAVEENELGRLWHF